METTIKPSGKGRKNFVEGRAPIKSPKSERPSSRRRRRATTYTRCAGAVNEKCSNEQRPAKRTVPARPTLSRKASCPEILLYRQDLTKLTLRELVKLVKIGEADLETLALVGMFPLHDAVEKGIVEIVRVLLDKSLNINLPSKEGLTPLDVAVQTGNFECAELLITHGASVVDIQDGFRRRLRSCKTF